MNKLFLLSAVFLTFMLGAEQQVPVKATYDMELNQGRVALTQKKYQEAEEFFARAEKLASLPWQHTRVRYCRAAALALQKKYDGAIALLKAGVPANQRSVYHTAYCAVMCGEYSAAAGNLKQAESEWKAALDAHPGNWIESRAMMRLGQAAEERRDHRTALKWYDRMKTNANALPAARCRGYMMSAALHAGRRQFDEAYAELDAAEKVPQLRPDTLAGIAMLRADLLTRQARHLESHTEILRALKIRDLTPPLQVTLLCRAAQGELRRNNCTAAVNFIRKAKKIRSAEKFFDTGLEKKIEKEYSDFQSRNKNKGAGGTRNRKKSGEK